MRTESFQSILNGVAKRLGMNPSRDLTPQTADKITEWVNDRVKEGWKFEFFPEWTPCEKRYLRETYDATQAVQAGDERYYIAAQACYQALQAQSPATQSPATLTGGVYVENSQYWAACADSYQADDWASGISYGVGAASGLPYQVRNPNDGEFYQCITAHTSGGSFDPTKFGKLKQFDRYIAYQQTQAGVALTTIDTVKSVTVRNPRVFSANPKELTFSLSDNGVQLPAGSAQVVYVTFRLPVPVFSSTLYSASENIAAGVIRYYPTTGECYLALQAQTPAAQNPTNGAYWKKVNFPSILASFVKRAAAGDGLKEQKQTDRGDDEIAQAQIELEEVATREMESQGQYERAGVQTYGS